MKTKDVDGEENAHTEEEEDKSDEESDKESLAE